MIYKFENGLFYEKNKHNDWKVLCSKEIYNNVFDKSFENGEVAKDNAHSIKYLFPDLKFSKFSVSISVLLSIVDEKIIIECQFKKKGKEYIIPISCLISDYIVVDNTWCYFSPSYYQFIQLIKDVGIKNCDDVSFVEYLELIHIKHQYIGLNIIDNVSVCLSDASWRKEAIQPRSLNAKLYPYQLIGFKWLKYITDAGCGCILGDEMGLGKTIQVISLFLDRADKKNYPYLVVAPLSLLENWKREINRFAPSLSVLVHHGKKRTGRYEDFLNYDVVVMSYGGVTSDLSILQMITWDILVLDEAHNIKNPTTQRTRHVKELLRRSAIAVTGTPFENHITDIWSLLDFVIPGCMGDLDEFNALYDDTVEDAELIEPVLSALMIRRKVVDVADDLPDRVDIPIAINMVYSEASKYEDARVQLISRLAGRNATLAALTSLRMYCTHPFLLEYDNKKESLREVSSKYDKFCDIVEEIIYKNEKVIVFTSYIEMSNLIINDIQLRFKILVKAVNGTTPLEKRQDIIDEFSNYNGAAMIVLNPKAAGAGLNITAANHVIHYNLEWNPAVEDQASARAYRRGQEKTVFIYRLYYANTVEELVNEKIIAKRELSEAAVIGSIGTENTQALINRALGISPLA